VVAGRFADRLRHEPQRLPGTTGGRPGDRRSSGFDIEVMSSDGGDRRSVVAGSASDERPRWSPEGTQLTYYSDAGGSWEVYTVFVETGATRSLTDGPGFDGQPAWQPTPR
jgi:Tol biopolymer transport system component